jgi:hypothetical protein
MNSYLTFLKGEKMNNQNRLSDSHYDQIKILYKFSKMLHYIEKHAKDNAKKAGDEKFHKLLNEIEEQLEKFVSQLNDMICPK